MISICISTYNRLPHLKRCLRSIIDGFSDKDCSYEVIIADGGSTDGTLEHLRKQKEVQLIEIGKPSGSIKALNKCFRRAKYKYIIFPNDDMEVVPEVLIKCCKLLDNHPEIGMVSPKMIESSRSNFPNIGLWNQCLIISKMHIMRTEVFRKVGFLSEKFRTYYVDADSTLDVLNLGYVILYSRETGVIHARIHDKTRKKNAPGDDTAEKEKYLYEQKWKYLEKNLQVPFLKKQKAFLFRALQSKMRESRIMKSLMERKQPFAIKLFDWVLQRCVIFEVKEYKHLKEFYLAQKLPEEVFKKKNKQKTNVIFN